jgi:hypothetical protein
MAKEKKMQRGRKTRERTVRGRRSRIDRLVDEAQTGRVDRMRKNQSTDELN